MMSNDIELRLQGPLWGRMNISNNKGQFINDHNHDGEDWT